MDTTNENIHKFQVPATSLCLLSPPAERVAVSEGTGNKKSALFLQGPDDIFVSVLLKKMKNLVI